MSNGELGEKEKIQIRLAEYNTLRAEIIARTTNAYQVWGLIAVVVIWILQQPVGSTLAIGVTLAVVGLSFGLWSLTRDVIRAGIRVQEIEREINDRAGEKLLVWENERGGLSERPFDSNRIPSFFRLKRKSGKRGDDSNNV